MGVESVAHQCHWRLVDGETFGELTAPFPRNSVFLPASTRMGLGIDEKRSRKIHHLRATKQHGCRRGPQKFNAVWVADSMVTILVGTFSSSNEMIPPGAASIPGATLDKFTATSFRSRKSFGTSTGSIWANHSVTRGKKTPRCKKCTSARRKVLRRENWGQTRADRDCCRLLQLNPRREVAC